MRRAPALSSHPALRLWAALWTLLGTLSLKLSPSALQASPDKHLQEVAQLVFVAGAAAAGVS